MVLNQINPEVFTRVVEQSGKVYVALDYSDLKPEFATQYQEFYPKSKKSPIVAQYTDGKFDRAFQSMVALNEKGNFVVMWGGFGNKDDWFEVFEMDFDVDDISGEAELYAYCKDSNVGFAVWQEKEKSSVSPRDVKSRMRVLTQKSNNPTQKLASLEDGVYVIESAKQVHSEKFNKTTWVLTINGQQYWANSRINSFLNYGVKAENKTLEISDHYITPAGYPAVVATITD